MYAYVLSFTKMQLSNILREFNFKMDALNDDFNGPNRRRIICQAKREMRKNKRVSFFPNGIKILINIIE